jgi:[acyl-carrier-protein] S-malonyltransferase
VGLDRLALVLRAREVRIGVVFPGQGSQSVGMGGALVEHFPAARDLFARAARVLGYDLLALTRNGPDDRLRETRFSQPAIYVTNFALAAAVGPDLPVVASAGHSFGEYCSLTLAGALTFEDALDLVQQRGLAMQEAAELAPGAMAAVLGLDPEPLRAAAAQAIAEGTGRVALANFNAPGQIVISGDRDAVARTGDLAAEAGAKRVVPLNVSGAWHSELMAPARAKFAPYVERARIELPRFDVISNVDAQPYRSVAEIRAKLVRSVTEEVRWHETAERLVAEGLDSIVEFGGSAVLAPLMKRVTNAPPAQHVGDERGVEKLRATVSAAGASA